MIQRLILWLITVLPPVGLVCQIAVLILIKNGQLTLTSDPAINFGLLLICGMGTIASFHVNVIQDSKEVSKSIGPIN